MARIRELVEQEAARAEVEDEPEDEDGDEPEGEPEDEPEGEDGDGPEARAFEEQLKRFERENVRHERELRKVMGDDFDVFEPCEACGSVGFRPLVAMPFDAKTEQCATCKGHGYLLTGAVREDRIVRECETCAGNGFVLKLPQQPRPEPYTPPAVRFDPYTGQPLAEQPPGGNGEQLPGWAPGYVPPGTSAPARTVGA